MKLSRLMLPPVLFGSMVVVLGVGLLAIFARSPQTHTNLAAAYQHSYSRTEQVVVGTPLPYVAPGINNASSISDPVTLGRELFVGLDCAACHGMKGQGGVFAPSVANSSVEKMQTRTHNGRDGMPAFANLTTAQLNDMAAYLKSASTQGTIDR